MSADRLIRRTHRWVAIVFLAAVVATIVALAQGSSALEWVVYTPLLPLVLLLLSGLCLFALPHLTRRRVAGRASER